MGLVLSLDVWPIYLSAHVLFLFFKLTTRQPPKLSMYGDDRRLLRCLVTLLNRRPAPARASISTGTGCRSPAGEHLYDTESLGGINLHID